jgi:hypothetical protein
MKRGEQCQVLVALPAESFHRYLHGNCLCAMLNRRAFVATGKQIHITMHHVFLHVESSALCIYISYSSHSTDR